MTDIMTASVPSHWMVKKLGQLFRERKLKVSDKDFPPLSVTKNGVVPQLDTAAKTDDGDNRKGVHAGDFVINSRSDRKGSSGISELRGSVSLINIVLEPLGIHPRFAHHLLRSVAFQEEFYRWGHGIVADLWTTRYFDMKSIRIAVPSYEEQQAIAVFLDRETGRIEQLIQKKQQELARLDEELRGFTTNVVTGFFHTGPVKPAPHRWLSPIPSHWNAPRLKFLCQNIVDCLHETPGYSESGEYPSIRTADVERGRLLIAKAKRVSAAEYAHRIQRLEPRAGDVLYTREGERFGLAALVPENTSLCLGQRMMMFRVNDRVRPEYLMWSLNGEFAYHYLRQSTAGATSPHLNIFDIRNVPIILPSLAEQDEIVSRIQRKAVRQWRLADVIEGSIERLGEVRSALVSEVVTGKVDIESWRRTPMVERRIEAIEIGTQA